MKFRRYRYNVEAIQKDSDKIGRFRIQSHSGNAGTFGRYRHIQAIQACTQHMCIRAKPTHSGSTFTLANMDTFRQFKQFKQYFTIIFSQYRLNKAKQYREDTFI